MNLMSGWHVAFVHPFETILTPNEGQVSLISSSIFSTYIFSLTNNVVLSLSELGGMYPAGAP
jgi:hypothetical protein